MGNRNSTPCDSHSHQVGDMANSWIVPLAGNAFVTRWHDNQTHTEVVTEHGLGNWVSERTTCSVYFYVTTPGEINLGLRLKVPDHGKSRIKLTLKDAAQDPRQEHHLDIKGVEYQIIPAGKFQVDKKGYVHVELQGVKKTGNYFADVCSLVVFCENEIRCVADDFYFGRRGPSVHLKYTLPPNKNITYFYNEITVPKGQDVLGAYFCAAGFHGGYFGIQVNSVNERRVLFSIWSPYQTDDPSEIPEDWRVQLVRKGENVYVGEFGNEGSGGQSYLRYNWKADSTYKFLVRGEPLMSNSIDDDEDELNSQFSAWFWTPEENKWIFIASFIRPKECVHLRSIYSFSENFLPETGHIVRKAFYGNQWVNDTEGRWHEIITAQFTGDATSKKNRLDFAGGVGKKDFYLKNCGFFNEQVQTGQFFSRCANCEEPDIDFDALP